MYMFDNYKQENYYCYMKICSTENFANVSNVNYGTSMSHLEVFHLSFP